MCELEGTEAHFQAVNKRKKEVGEYSVLIIFMRFSGGHWTLFCFHYSIDFEALKHWEQSRLDCHKFFYILQQTDMHSNSGLLTDRVAIGLGSSV